MSAFDSLDAYVNWLDGVLLPTHEQRERFVNYAWPSHPLWPESSGGLDTLGRIFERHRSSDPVSSGHGNRSQREM
jgi:hypothetical protein